MDATTPFHARFPTDVDQEISMAENLYISARLRYGERLSNMVRRNPADVWRRFHYCRVRSNDSPVPFALVVQGMDYAPETKASAADILTPDVHAWREFVDQLVGELSGPDATWRFAPARRCHCGTSGLEFWPLASAELVRRLGFAVAETLAVFLTFHASTDQDVLEFVERIWRRVRPGRRSSRKSATEGKEG